jgi:hypothetical protein
MKRLLALGAVNLLVLALLGLAALGGLEGYLRLTVPPSSHESIYQYTLATPRYKVMKPNASVTAWGSELRTNALGFRDEPVPPKRPGEFRIVVLGDSFTVSAGVDYPAIWTSLLRERLGVRVVNLAVGGYNVVQYALVLKEVGLALQPDMVLVALYPDNDFSMDNYEANRRVARGEQPERPELAWYESAYVYRAYLAGVHARLRSRGTPEAAAAAGADREGWERNVAALVEIAQTARRGKLELAVVLLPRTWDLEGQRALFERVEGACREHGLRCWNLLQPILARAGGEKLRLNALDAHPNARYNALVAEELALRLIAYASPDGRQAP